MKDVRVMGRNTQGVKLANLKDQDYLVMIQKIEGSASDSETSDNPEIVEDVTNPPEEEVNGKEVDYPVVDEPLNEQGQDE